MDFTKKQLEDRVFLRVAMLIRSLWEEGGRSDTRLLDFFLIPDELTKAGRSVAAVPGVKTHREHVVPRRVIIEECKRRLKKGATDAQIAELVRANLKIVAISEDERRHLDRSAAIGGLRQKMPEWWRFGDDVFARLDAAGIAWIPTSAELEAVTISSAL